MSDPRYPYEPSPPATHCPKCGSEKEEAWNFEEKRKTLVCKNCTQQIAPQQERRVYRLTIGKHGRRARVRINREDRTPGT